MLESNMKWYEVIGLIGSIASIISLLGLVIGTGIVLNKINKKEFKNSNFFKSFFARDINVNQGKSNEIKQEKKDV